MERINKAPKECSGTELKKFNKLVSEDGEVSLAGFLQRTQRSPPFINDVDCVANIRFYRYTPFLIGSISARPYSLSRKQVYTLKLPNWFKIVWWTLLTAALTHFLYNRYPDLTKGNASVADIVVFVIWIALLLAPLFNEVSMFGLKLKQEMDELKGFLTAQVSEIRSDVRNAVDVRTTFSPHFNLPLPAADAQLPDLEARIKSALIDALAAHGVPLPPAPVPITAPDDTAFLFAARYNIELEMRRIAEELQIDTDNSSRHRRVIPIQQLARHLSESNLLEPRLVSAIREVYSICSYAIHGEPVSEAQLAFVHELAPELVATLKAIRH
ncbi:hypothetical protein ACI51W_06360 [Pseudomonas marginalis]|uniref:hypothetical protein n=1 Tax=Pseudomonas TaxID=286 RepID=UPI000A090610|nr:MULTISPECIES: hypothetical protein [unclassified Pseudomonas]PUB43907.1 hypothetical protein C8K58_1062 [Pseudomonas sp. GV047]SMF11223.1 hypothetical protein SAMN05660912_01516 [Pseudomonas sp. LAMO17WK12:I1]